MVDNVHPVELILLPPQTPSHFHVIFIAVEERMPEERKRR
jgi:hypothetical protein